MTFTWHDSDHPSPLGKFLVLEGKGEMEIVAGNFEWHADIPRGGRTVVGAGVFTKDGFITRWNSTGLGVETPHGLRRDIEGAFKYHAALIASSWQGA